MPTPIHISVVAPAYRCAACLRELHRRLVESLSGLTDSFEIILVNDGSPQEDWQIISELAAADPRVVGINLSRNFGQHVAISAGLDHARGEWVVVMDADLQDQPEEIPNLYAKVREGFDVVFAQRHERQDSAVKKLASRFFGMIYNTLSDVKLDTSTANFSIISRKVAEQFRRVREQHRAYSLIIRWLGFRVTYVPVQHAARYAGNTSYSLWRSINLAVDSIVSQSIKPLLLSIRVGFLLSLLAVLFGVYLIIRRLFFHVEVPGWASVMVSINFLSGLMLANMGILGVYLGKVFEQGKGRPLYVVMETRNVVHTDEPEKSLIR